MLSRGGEKEKTSFLVSLLIRALIPSRGPHPPELIIYLYFPKVLFQISLRVRASAEEFGGVRGGGFQFSP
jgi:hypothetical protein